MKLEKQLNQYKSEKPNAKWIAQLLNSVTKKERNNWFQRSTVRVKRRDIGGTYTSVNNLKLCCWCCSCLWICRLLKTSGKQRTERQHEWMNGFRQGLEFGRMWYSYVVRRNQAGFLFALSSQVWPIIECHLFKITRNV